MTRSPAPDRETGVVTPATVATPTTVVTETTSAVTQPTLSQQNHLPEAVNPEPHAEGPRPIGTLTVIAILLLVTLAFWMMVLGVQQGRA